MWSGSLVHELETIVVLLEKKKKRLVHEQTGENCKNHCIKYNTLDFEKS